MRRRSGRACCSLTNLRTLFIRELFARFARLIQDLATELNVQVFLSTHSKEAIDAFIMNETRTEEVVGYAINRTSDGGTAMRYSGGTLRKLVDAVDFDLRGVR